MFSAYKQYMQKANTVGALAHIDSGGLGGVSVLGIKQ